MRRALLLVVLLGPVGCGGGGAKPAATATPAAAATATGWRLVALAHPDRVSRLVLDPVVPHAGLEMTWAVPMQATGRVLGTRDLSTPLEWARAELARAPGGRLVTVAGAGHSLQSQDRPQVERALGRFLRNP